MAKVNLMERERDMNREELTKENFKKLVVRVDVLECKFVDMKRTVEELKDQVQKSDKG